MRSWVVLVLGFGCGGGGGAVDASVSHEAPPIDAPPPLIELPLIGVEGGIAYTASVTIGGTQSFQLDIDTGSATLGVAATTCTACTVTPEYTPGTAALDVGRPTSAQYGDGTTWTGEIFQDTVALTGDTSNLRMAFGSIQMESGFFRGNDDQGIIGFGRATLATSGTDAYVDQRKAAHLSTAFAFQFCGDTGRVWLDGFDPTFTSAPPQYSPLVPQAGFYEVTVQGATIGGTSIGLVGPAIADTGTTLMIVPTTVARALINDVQASPGFASTFPGMTLSGSTCLDGTGLTNAQIDAALPPMTVTLPDTNGVNFTLTVPATQSYLFENQGSYCLGVAGVDGLPTILGDTFLRAFISVFDVPNFQIGFAPQIGCPLSPHAHRTGSLVPPHYYLRGQRT